MKKFDHLDKLKEAEVKDVEQGTIWAGKSFKKLKDEVKKEKNENI